MRTPYEPRWASGRDQPGPLPIGTYGEISVTPAPGRRTRFRDRVRFRDVDGITRHVERVGSSRAVAVNNLRAALRDRQWTPAGGEITTDSTIGAVAAVWLRELDESDRAIRTKITYRDVLGPPRRAGRRGPAAP